MSKKIKNNKTDKKNIYLGLIYIGIIVLALIIYLVKEKSYDNWVEYILDQYIENAYIETAQALYTNCGLKESNCIGEDTLVGNPLSKKEYTELLNKYKESTFETKDICNFNDEISFPRLIIEYTKYGEIYYLEIEKNEFITNDSKLEELLIYNDIEYEEPDCDYPSTVTIPSFDITKDINKYIG